MKNTPGTDRAFERLKQAVGAGDPGVPDGTVFIPADLPEIGSALEMHLSEGHPVALVRSDGHREILIEPHVDTRGRLFLWFTNRFPFRPPDVRLGNPVRVSVSVHTEEGVDLRFEDARLGWPRPKTPRVRD